MSLVKSQNIKCAICNQFIKKRTGTPKVISTEEDLSEFSQIFTKEIFIGDTVCGYCRMLKYKKRKIDEENGNTCQEPSEQDIGDDSTSQLSASQSSGDDPSFVLNTKHGDIEYVNVPIQRTVSTHSYCCVCFVRKNNLILIPKNARIQAYIKRRIYIPEGNRCCSNHIINKRFFEEDINLLKVHSNTSNIESSELKKLMDCLAVECDSSLFDKMADYCISEEQLRVFTGLTWENLIQLRTLFKSMRNTDTRTITQAIIVFLFKLRTGNSNKLISSILQLDQEQLVSHYSAQVIQCFENDILPNHFGFSALSRDNLIVNQTSAMAKQLYDETNEKLILICDGTYAYHQKSYNNEYQRKSYSCQKKTSLCKPFTICTTSGYIVEMLGPYYANKNDASIMREVIDEPTGLRSLLRPGDIFVVDRGFRDVKEYLEIKNYQVPMPALKGKRNQLTTSESNKSRCVTKIRWPVEATHGMIKAKFKLLGQEFDNKLLPKVRSYFRIASYLHNRFNKRLSCDVELSDEVINRIVSRRNVENSLAEQVKNEGWLRKRLIFQTMLADDLVDFPEMTENDLKILYTGSYQFKQAISYLAEIIDETGNICLQFLKDDTSILKALVQSRHISKKKYKCFVEYVPHSIGYNGVTRYYCECANGSRTIGCCSHIAAIIYYLAHGRYLARIPKPAEILSQLFTKDNINVVIEKDSDED